MPPNPAMVVRVAANIEELRKNLAEGRNQIEVTTAGMQKLANSFTGDRIIQGAHNVVAAVKEIGGVQKLTEAEMARVNATLERAIEKYRALGQEAPTHMVELAKATKNVEQPTESLTSTYSRFDGILRAVGINIGPQVKALEDMKSAAAGGATSLGLLGTAGVALGVGLAAWGITRAVMEFFELDKSIEAAWRQLLNFGDVAAETAGAKQDVINRAIANGAKETISYTEAIQFNIDAVKRNADAKIDWNVRLANAQREVRGLTEAQIKEIEIAQKAGATTEQITNKYNVSADALRVLAERQRETARATEEHKKKLEALDTAYNKLMSDVRNAEGLAQMEEAAAALRRQAENAAQLRLMERDAWQMEFAAREQQIQQEAAAESARIAQNQAEIDAILNTGKAHQDAGALAKQASDQTMAGYAGVATQIQITGEAMREWIELMRYTNEVNAILSDSSSLFTSQSQRERIAKIPIPRANGGPVMAGQTYMVGEPERFVPSQSGTIIPNGGGTTVVHVTIAPGAVVQHFPIGGSDPVAKQMLSQELGDVFIWALRNAGFGLA